VKLAVWTARPKKGGVIMLRGQVVGEEARAWTAGLLLATDYFALARRQAVAKANAAIRGRLHRSRQAMSEDRGTSR
jgi:hypothetical protein